jgi:hypothetical protein
MAVVKRVALFEREIRLRLSSAALEILFDHAEVLSEGQRSGAGYFGSTMVTIDLSRAAEVLREPCDASSARRVAELCALDPRVKARAKGLATSEAAARAGARLERLTVDVKTRAVGARVHIDLDVEGVVTRSSTG